MERDDREEKKRLDAEERRLAAEEAERQREAEAAVREAQEEKERAERAATRALQMPLLDAALAAVDTLSSTSIEGDAAASGAAQLQAAKQGVLDAAALLLSHETVGQGANESATATAEAAASSIVSLRSTGFADLTKDALASAVSELKRFLTSFVVPAEPEPEAPVAKKSSGKKKPKKKAAKKKAAASSEGSEAQAQAQAEK